MVHNHHYFRVELSIPNHAFFITPKDTSEIRCETLIGQASYHVLEARLLGVSYDTYLRICAGMGARIKGKNSMFPVAYFDDGETAKRICTLLNKRMAMILWEIDNNTYVSDYIDEMKQKIDNLSKKVDKTEENSTL